MRAFAKAVVSAAVLAGVLVGVPLLLMRFGSWPIHGVPSIHQLRSARGQILTDDVVFSILTVAAWLAWAAFAASVVLELAAEVVGLPRMRLPLGSPFQAAAGHLVAAMLVTTGFAGHVGGRATTAPPLQTTTVPSSTAASPTTTASPSTTVVPPATTTAPSLPPTSPPSSARHDHPTTTPAPTAPGAVGPSVVVKSGDSPWSIAERHLGDGMRWREVWDLNRVAPQVDGSMWVDPQRLSVGWTLHLPTDATSPAADDVGSSNEVDGSGQGQYVVQPGDTLSGIAQARLGDAAAAGPLFEANAGRPQPDGKTLTDPNLILPGWQLELSEGKGRSSNGATPPAVASTPPPSPAPAPPTATPAAPTSVPSMTSVPSPGSAPQARKDRRPDTAPQEPPPPSGRRQSGHAAQIVPSTSAPLSVAPAERPRRLNRARTGEGLFARTAPTIAGITGSLVLGTAVLDLLIRKRRRRVDRGIQSRPVGGTAAVTERAVTAAADLPFVRWAGQAIAEMVADFDTRASRALPVAVELSEEDGLEVLWSEPVSPAPEPWKATEAGWSWTLAYDPDAPVPVDALPARLPSLVTVGRRDGKQLLINVEAFGAVGVVGPIERSTDFLRSVAIELSLGEELSDAYSLVFGMDLSPEVPGSRGEAVSAVDAGVRLVSARKSLDAVLGDTSNGAFAYRAGPEAPHVETTVAIGSDVSDEEASALVTAAESDRGVALVIADPAGRCGCRIELSADGAVLHPLGIEFEPVQLPDRSEAALSQLLLDEKASGEAPGPTGGRDSDLDCLVDLRSESSTVPTEGVAECEVSSPRSMPEMLVRVLGSPRVDGRPSLGTRQVSLTAFLALKGRPATISDIIEALWGGDEVRPKTAWNLVSSTRGGLGQLDSGADVLPAADQALKTYSLASGVTTDYEILRRAFKRSLHDPDARSIEELDHALGLVDGRPFGTAGFEWAFRDGQYGTAAGELIEQAALRLAGLALDADDVDLARRAIRQGLHGLPGNEALYRERMKIEADAGNAAGVQQAYKELVHYLIDFDERPSQETIDLRVALRRRSAVQPSV